MTLTVPIPHVRALWRPEQYTRVANGGFETNTTGWAVTAGINDAGTSITRITSDFHSGAACGSLVTGVTGTNAGVNFDFGTEPFYIEATYGTTYAALVWLKWVSGGTTVAITLGSEGTAADRATLTIRNLPAVWTPYRVLWMPTATRTDAQLAITNGSTDLTVTVLIDDASVYQVDAFSQVENGNFTADTSGWVVTADINAAGTSITQASGDGFAWAGNAAQTYATLVTTGTSGSGANYKFGLRKFTSGRTYRARVALKSVSGTTSARLRLGSIGTGADRGDTSALTITTSWSWYLVDWTASGDRTDVELAVTNGAASVMTARVSCVEVYEAIDELNGTGTGVRADVRHMDWSRGIDSAPGTLNLVLHDPRDARRYTPWYTSGALYGLLEPGRRVWARAVYSDTTLYPVAFGTIRRIVPDAQAGSAQILCEDPMYDIGRATVSRLFVTGGSYAEARAGLFGPAADEPIGGGSRYSLADGIEWSDFYDGTDGETSALDYLEQLNEATGTAHHIAPDARAEVLWRYTTVDRASLADAATSDETIDDDFMALTGTDKTDEALENTQAVTWQAYEIIQLPAPFDPVLVQAADVTVYDGEDDDPYLHFRDDRWGTDEGIPEPTYEKHWRWHVRHWIHHGSHGRTRKLKKKVRVRTPFFRRIYPGAFVPFTVAAGTPKVIDVDFSVPIEDMFVFVGSTLDNDAKVLSPRQVRVTIYGAGTADVFRIYGQPWLPLEEVTETPVAYDQVLAAGVRDGPSLNTPYIASAGMAQGLGAYRNWRYSTARMRPTLSVQHRFPSILQRDPSEHLTVNAALYSLSGAVFTITRMTGSADMGARLWQMDYELEELPTSPGTLFTLDTSALDGTDVLSY